MGESDPKVKQFMSFYWFFLGLLIAGFCLRNVLLDVEVGSSAIGIMVGLALSFGEFYKWLLKHRSV